jgi:hypothetical protein
LRVGSHQPHGLRDCLGNKQPVKRIGMKEGQPGNASSVPSKHGELLKTALFDFQQKIVRIYSEFTNARLDCGFPYGHRGNVN